MSTISVDPAQLPQFIAQHKAQKEALEKVIEFKKQILSRLSLAQKSVGPEYSGDQPSLATAIHEFISVQIIEYEMQLIGFQEKLDQTIEILSKADSAVLVATAGSVPPAPPPGFRGFRPPGTGGGGHR